MEELRRQQKAAERRKNCLFVGSAIVIALILIGAAIIPAYLHDQANKKKLKAGYQASPTKAEAAAGCDGVHNDPISKAALHVTTPIDYSKEKYGDTRGGTPPIPPSNGRHNPVSLGDTNRFYPLSQQPRCRLLSARWRRSGQVCTDPEANRIQRCVDLPVSDALPQRFRAGASDSAHRQGAKTLIASQIIMRRRNFGW